MSLHQIITEKTKILLATTVKLIQHIFIRGYKSDFIMISEALLHKRTIRRNKTKSCSGNLKMNSTK